MFLAGIAGLSIGMLVAAPILVVAAMLRRTGKRRVLAYTALIAMTVGTGAAWFCLAESNTRESTSAASRAVDRDWATLPLFFTAATVIYATMLVVPRLLRSGVPSTTPTGLVLAFLVLYAGGLLLLFGTERYGGQTTNQEGTGTPTSIRPPREGPLTP